MPIQLELRDSESKSKELKKEEIIFFCPDTGKEPDMNKADRKS